MPKQTTAKSKFISFEGIDGAGKTSNMNALAKYLREQGKTVYVTREPGGTRLGERIRDIVLQAHHDDIVNEAELLLMFAARVQHIEEVIKPKLDQGTWVLSDRFVDASFAYQGAGRGVDLARMEQLSNWALQSCYPDLTIVFNLSVKLSIERMVLRNNDTSANADATDNPERLKKLDRFEQQKDDFKHRVNEYYRALQSNDERQYFHLDASNELPEVKKQLIAEVGRRWFA